MRVADRQALARALRNASGDFLLVLTSDYESLDFVLLERILPAEAGDDGLGRRQVIVRPRTLTVDRHNPGPVAPRVLRRFSYTEIDPPAQVDKLLSAYTVAEWSEPLFNNRALFPDYYLKERLAAGPEWAESPDAVYRQLLAPLENAIERATRTWRVPAPNPRKRLREGIPKSIWNVCHICSRT